MWREGERERERANNNHRSNDNVDGKKGLGTNDSLRSVMDGARYET